MPSFNPFKRVLPSIRFSRVKTWLFFKRLSDSPNFREILPRSFPPNLSKSSFNIQSHNITTLKNTSYNDSLQRFPVQLSDASYTTDWILGWPESSATLAKTHPQENRGEIWRTGGIRGLAALNPQSQRCAIRSRPLSINGALFAWSPIRVIFFASVTELSSPPSTLENHFFSQWKTYHRLRYSNKPR